MIASSRCRWAKLAALAAFAALGLSPAACMTSRSPAKYVRATSIEGVFGSVELRNGQTHAGELLAVDDSAFVILKSGRVGRARFGELQSVRFRELGSVTFVRGKAPPAEKLARARMLSRFPYGISPSTMTVLLAASRQDAPEELASQAP